MAITSPRSADIRQTLSMQWRAFLDWWGSELAALLPASWRSGATDPFESCLSSVEDGVFSVRRHQGGRWVEVARKTLEGSDFRAQQQAVAAVLKAAHLHSDQPYLLALPPRQVLRKEIALPLAAEENLRTVIQYEIDHYTPFRAEQVYFDYRLLHRDAALGKLTVLLGVVPRGVVDQALQHLHNLGLKPAAAITLDDLVPNVPPLNFLPDTARPKRNLRLSKSNLALLALVILLGIAAILLPIWIKREASIQLIPVVTQADRATQKVEQLRDRVQAEQQIYNLLSEKKRTQPSALLLLDELTRLLPKDTWVQQLNLNGNTLQIQGDTGSASKLIGLIENSRVLSGANFTAPLTKGAGENTEHFQLSMQVDTASLVPSEAQLKAQPAQTPQPQRAASQPAKPQAPASSAASAPTTAASAARPSAASAPKPVSAASNPK
ncbi:PilN domain-containing protein [Thiomonas sp.]